MNPPPYFLSCVLFASLISFAALMANRMLRRFATARHGMLLSALVLILVCPAWIALLRTPQVASRNPLPGLLTSERDTPMDNESNMLLPLLAELRAETEVASLMERYIESTPIDQVLREEDEALSQGDVMTSHAYQPATASGAFAESAIQAKPLWAQFMRAAWLVFPALVVVSLLGTLVGLIRVVLGLGRLRRILRSSSPVSSPLVRECFAEACERVGIQPESVRLATSDQVEIPIAARLIQSVVVLPREMVQDDSTSDVRQVLIHELAHVKRRDQWVVILQHLTSAIHWWNPLVHRLNRCLAEAREEICDNYVLENCDAPSYCRTLLQITQRQSPSMVPFGAVGLFTSRWKLEQRIQSLLNANRNRATAMTWRGRSLIGLGVLLVLAMGSQLAIPVEAVEPQITGSSESPAETPVVTQSNEVSEELLQSLAVAGFVKDEFGRPIESATVVAFYQLKEQREVVILADTSDAEGRFEFTDIPLTNPDLKSLAIYSHASGHAIQSRRVHRHSGSPPLNADLLDLDFELQPEAVGIVDVVDEEGQPVAGAVLNQLQLKGETLTSLYLYRDVWEQLGLPVPTSDENGRMEIPSISQAKVYDVQLVHPEFAKTPIWETPLSETPLTAVIEKGNPVKFVVKSPTDSDKIDQAKIEVVVNEIGGVFMVVCDVPEDGIVETRLRDANSNISIKHPTLVSRSWHFYRKDKPTMEFSLHRTGTVRGRVVDAETGDGVGQMSISFSANHRQLHRLRTDEEGYYEGEVAEGEYSVQIEDSQGQWKATEDDRREIHVAANEIVQMKTFTATKSAPIQGRVLFESGKPVANAIVLQGFRQKPILTDTDGKFAVVRGSRRNQVVYAIHPTKKLSRVTILPNEAKHLEMVLAPEGSLNGVVIDSDGNALVDVPASLKIQVSSRSNGGSNMSTTIRTKQTDQEGAVRFDGLIEGAHYALEANGKFRSSFGERLRQSSRFFDVAAAPWEDVELKVHSALEAELNELARYQQAPGTIQPLRATHWLNGDPVDVASGEANFRLIVFGRSKHSFQEANLVHQFYGDQGVQVVGVVGNKISGSENRDVWARELQIPIAVDDGNAKMFSRYGFDSNGGVLLYGADGQLIERINGGRDLLWIMRNHVLYRD
ncbi:M56 family metallopeptidase [Rhodopirellula baltica]|uniref:Regulatory protein blaR1 n=1 Tax=Rhodopirellula baltica WH47 TaxID=991778 RepID=F2AYK9_RHOBT|nr:M56 family metallopeptidase [Rhodopirellula baltica]EGF25206.1 regulatory protein blaR1 [Rhodopirellula baltica WH47]